MLLLQISRVICEILAVLFVIALIVTFPLVCAAVAVCVLIVVGFVSLFIRFEGKYYAR